MVISVFAFSVSAKSGGVGVYINNVEYMGNMEVKNYTTFVGIRNFSCAMDKNASVNYDYSSRTLTVKTGGLVLSAQDDSNYIIANGRYLYTETPIYMKNGVMYAPVMLMAKAFGAKISWSDATSSFYITKGSGAIASAEAYYDSDCVYWLSKIITAEAADEPMLGKIAVGNVILNRVRSKEFPNTIYGVIFDKNYGIQFTPVANGTIYNTPTEQSIIAAKICLEGYSINNDILYFVNPTKSPNSWVSKNEVFYRQIGNHAFYF